MYTIKQIASRLVNKGVKDGEIWKSSICEKCGLSGIKLNGHHFDYNKPFEVVWLCVRCHSRVHELLDKAQRPIKMPRMLQQTEEEVSKCAIVYVKYERISSMSSKRYVISGWKCECQINGI